MPECDEVDVKIDPKDIEMSTMRSGGAGGQVSEIVGHMKKRGGA
jgi:protein subunit release factor A